MPFSDVPPTTLFTDTPLPPPSQPSRSFSMSPGFDPTRLEGRYLTLFNQGELGLQRLLSAAGTLSMGRAGAAFNETLVHFVELIELIKH